MTFYFKSSAHFTKERTQKIGKHLGGKYIKIEHFCVLFSNES